MLSPDSRQRHSGRVVIVRRVVTASIGAVIAATSVVACGSSRANHLSVGASATQPNKAPAPAPTGGSVAKEAPTSAADALSLAAPGAFGGIPLSKSSKVNALEYVTTTYNQAESVMSQISSWRPINATGVSSGTTVWVIEATGSFQREHMTSGSPDSPVAALVFVTAYNVPGVWTYYLANTLDLTSLGMPQVVPVSQWSAYGSS